MTKIWTALIVTVPLLVGGCASLPSPETLRDLPVVRFGDPVPAGRDYILFFPPDTPISLFGDDPDGRTRLGWAVARRRAHTT